MGKPWLHEVRGIHNYVTDVIEIEGDEKQPNHMFIPNMEDELHQVADASVEANEATTPNAKQPKASTALTSIAKLSATEEPTLEDMIEAEYKHTRELQAREGRFTESRWSPFLEVEQGEDEVEKAQNSEPSKEPLWFITEAEQRNIVRRRKINDRDNHRQRRKDQFKWLTEETAKYN